VGLVDVAAATARRHAMLADGDRVLVAVSGGADSVALLHVLRELTPRLRLSLHVLHVDHGLRPDSPRDAHFVRRLGGRLGVPVDVAAVSVVGSSGEAAARAARYAALERAADRIGAQRIALGHTAEDQAETVLMRLLTGTGPFGLAAIPAVRGRIVRPLLDARRADVVAALQRAGLDWVEDPTNRDRRFLRNHVRHDLLPRLDAAAGSDLVDRLARVARLARETADVVARLAAVELQRVATVERDAVVVPRAALAALPERLATEVLRQAVARLGGRTPLRAWGYRGLRRVLRTAPARRPFRVNGVGLEVSGDRIRVGVAPPLPLTARPLAVPGRVELPEIGRCLAARVVPAAGYAVPREAACVALDAAMLPRALVVRARRRGDRFRPFGGGERRLKSFLIDARVPRWDRGRLPVVEADGRILWLAGLRRASAAPVTADTREILELALLPLADVSAGG
jgi:tRNA(Ile)-lysidine synthase